MLELNKEFVYVGENMIDKAYVVNFSKTYKKNMDLNMGYNSLKKIPNGIDSWTKSVINMSDELRLKFMENESMLDNLKSEIDLGLDINSAKLLYELLLDLYYNSYTDSKIVKLIAIPLSKFYEGLKNFEYLIAIYNILAYELLKGVNQDKLLGISYYYKIISLKDKYSLINTKKIRRIFFTTYKNLISQLMLDDESRNECFMLYSDCLDLWNSNTVKKLDSLDKEFQKSIEMVHESFLLIETYVDNLNENNKEKFYKIAIDDYNDFIKLNVFDDTGSIIRAYIKAKLMKNEIEIDNALKCLIDYYYTIPYPNYNSSDSKWTTYLLNYLNTSLSILKIIPKSNLESKDMEIKKILSNTTFILNDVPYEFRTEFIAKLCKVWFDSTTKYLKNIEEKESFINKFIISNELNLLIHTIMVSKICMLIYDELIENNPSYFVGLPNYNNIDDVINNKEKLRDYLNNASRLFDIGKINMSNLINVQNRKLTSLEYESIKEHTKLGPKVLNNDKEFIDYYDIMLYHHKSYDGKSGYPEDLDNTKSVYKPVTDLITICDTIDAATDNLEKSYSSPKSFNLVLEELIKGKGTLYNPIIVSLIENNINLISNLDYITSKGRIMAYYEAYAFNIQK